MGEEIWKDIPGFEWKYQASSLGNIMSLRSRYRIRNKPRKQSIERCGYKRVILCLEWIKRGYMVHRLVAHAFMQNIQGKSQINHKNWIRDDNRIENLEWCTSSENMKHSYESLWRIHPKWMLWKFNINWKVIYQYDKDMRFIKVWWSLMEVERELWIWHSNVRKACIVNNYWHKTAGGFIWRTTDCK